MPKKPKKGTPEYKAAMAARKERRMLQQAKADQQTQQPPLTDAKTKEIEDEIKAMGRALSAANQYLTSAIAKTYEASGPDPQRAQNTTAATSMWMEGIAKTRDGIVEKNKKASGQPATEASQANAGEAPAAPGPGRS